ncbi:alpha/beta hydrolase, partial [Achromatium sp. WMS3]
MSIFNTITFKSHDGLTLFTRDYAAISGTAKLPVICIHGLTRNSADFEEFAPWVASLGHRVLAIDVRGRGKSAYDPNPANYNPYIYTRDINTLLHDLGIARAIFVGTSMGGIIIMTLALQNLRLVGAAILNDVGPVLSPRGLQRIAGYAGRSKLVSSWIEAAEYVQYINQSAFPKNTPEDWLKFAKRTFVEDS